MDEPVLQGVDEPSAACKTGFFMLFFVFFPVYLGKLNESILEMLDEF